jgi:hypothetical protein
LGTAIMMWESDTGRALRGGSDRCNLARMADETANRESFHVQAGYCAAMDAPITARVCTALAEALDRGSETGRRVLDWPGEPVADALALRLVGGLHALHRKGHRAGVLRRRD